MNSRLSIFRWINFYAFGSFGVWVWDPKLVYWLQNSSGYALDASITTHLCSSIRNIRNKNAEYFSSGLKLWIMFCLLLRKVWLLCLRFTSFQVSHFLLEKGYDENIIENVKKAKVNNDGLIYVVFLFMLYKAQTE